jgi:hypothetical protein
MVLDTDGHATNRHYKSLQKNFGREHELDKLPSTLLTNRQGYQTLLATERETCGA